MTVITVVREIAAPPETVFHSVAEVERLPETDPDVVRVEFLQSRRSGPGTRFRETRRMKNRELVTELEMTEYVENEKLRMVAESHGTTWDTTFRVRPSDLGTRLEIAMTASSDRLLNRILNRVMKGFFRRGMKKHILAVATRCEADPGAS